MKSPPPQVIEIHLAGDQLEEWSTTKRKPIQLRLDVHHHGLDMWPIFWGLLVAGVLIAGAIEVLG